MFRALTAAAVGCLSAGTYVQAQTVLTLEDTFAIARTQAGSVVVARARVAEAGASLVAANVRFRDNPVFEANAGPRTTANGHTIDLDVGLSQQFETGGQRSARVVVAQAGVDREEATAGDVLRTVLLDAGRAFLNGVGATERVRIAEDNAALSRQFLAATERRFSAGDVAAMAVNLARIDLARSTAQVRSAQADLLNAIATLRGLLRLPATTPLQFQGGFQLPEPAPLERLRLGLNVRPDLVALNADVRQAFGQAQLGRALRRSDLGLRIGYEREETNAKIQGGFTVTLPSFQRGQGTLAAGLARGTRARLELEVTRERAANDLDAAYADYEQRLGLSAAFASETLPSVLDNETLARRSYDAGELGLMDYLRIRRDAVDLRTAIVDRQLEAALSRLNLDFVSGVLR